MNKDIIDVDDVLERVQDDRELLLELLDIFEEDYLEKRQKLQEFIEQEDFEQIRNLIHSIKGASGNISARAFHATCAQIEQWVEKNDMPRIKGDLSKLDQQFTELRQYIIKLKQKFKTSI